jgi:hypothetical protein
MSLWLLGVLAYGASDEWDVRGGGAFVVFDRRLASFHEIASWQVRGYLCLFKLFLSRGSVGGSWAVPISIGRKDFLPYMAVYVKLIG